MENKFRISSGHKTQESTGKVGTTSPASVTPLDCTLEYRKGSANGIANFLGPFSRA